MGSIVGTMVFAMLWVASCSRASDPSAPSSPGGTGSTSSGPSMLDLSDCPELPCKGTLVPGGYRWTFSDPSIAFTITSPGWTWYYSGSLRIVADETPSDGLHMSDGIYFLRDPSIASQDCVETAEPGVGRSVSDLTAWLEAAPGLAVSKPTPVTVGGLDGMQLDLQIDPAWNRTCFFSEGLPAVPLIFNGSDLGGYAAAMVPDQWMRWYILDSDDGVIIVDIEDSPGFLSHDDLVRTGSEIVESLAFSSP
jgi:hypothetical protein